MYIASIGYNREVAPEDRQWVRIGSIWHTEDTTEIRLRGFHRGQIWANLFPNITNPPFLQGDICTYYRSHDDKLRRQWCGRLYAYQNNDSKTTYMGFLEVMPCVQFIDDELRMILVYDEKGEGK